MQYCTPEQAGIPSAQVLKFYQTLDNYKLSTHSVILSRGDQCFSEAYWKPFSKNFLHRMYSVTKSFVSIAIGFCEQDGLLSLDDPIIKFFPEAQQGYAHSSTIREMLQMTTTLDKSAGWFSSGTNDRVAHYFQKAPQKHADTLFAYDSAGSFILGAVVERLTGKTFLKYLQEKVLSDIGFSENAYCLTCPGGHSWADSGLLCTTQDLWLFARFVLNKGTWKGKQYLNREYILKATSSITPNNPFGFCNGHTDQGYGYQFWCAPNGCFAAKGMGNQLAFCDPVHDFILVINSDNQGNYLKYQPIYEALYTHILPYLGQPLQEDSQALKELREYENSRELFCLYENTTSPLSRKIEGKHFNCDENPMGIRWFELNFKGTEGTFTFENSQGRKVMHFGLGHNVFHFFPQEGYSDLVGSVSVPGHRYNAAFSADWPSDNTLRIRVQIIDKYFGNLSILIAFRDADHATIRMEKAAEAFLGEYSGLLNATAI